LVNWPAAAAPTLNSTGSRSVFCVPWKIADDPRDANSICKWRSPV